MTTYPTLSCALRAGVGSNAAHKLRQQGLVPATVYGHGPALSLTMTAQAFTIATHAGNSGSQIVRISIDGVDAGLALVKSIQRNMLKRTPIHMDLQRISLQEMLQVPVPILLEGEPVGITEGGKLEVNMHMVLLRCKAGEVPEHLTYDISGMHLHDTLTAGQLPIPEGGELGCLPEECVAAVRVRLV